MSVQHTLALAALAGAMFCRTESPEPRGAPAPPAATPSAPAVTDSTPDSLALELVLPRQVRQGDPVPIALRVRNRTGRTLDLYLRGRTPTFDVVVARPDGRVVWRRLEGEILQAIVHLRTLAPGERLEIETSWDQRTKRGPIEPGDYTARGLLLVEGEPMETPAVPFRVVAR